MARARTSLRYAEHIDIHEDDIKDEEAEETLDESMDPLEESGHSADSSEEEVEDSVQEDMARFEESFAGISKRFRLINRIGEGMSQPLACSMQGNMWAHIFLQAHSQQCTRQRIWSTTTTATTGTSKSARTTNGWRLHTHGKPPNDPTM